MRCDHHAGKAWSGCGGGVRDVVWFGLVWFGGEGIERGEWVYLFVVGIGSDFGMMFKLGW
jgi:hypothetical protein